MGRNDLRPALDAARRPARRDGPMTAAVQAPSYPLTPLQEGMLFHSRLASGSGVYVQQLVVHMPEAVDADALRQAWRFVVERHEALRTAFPDDADAIQVVADEAEVPFEEVEGANLQQFLAA